MKIKIFLCQTFNNNLFLNLNLVSRRNNILHYSDKRMSHKIISMQQQIYINVSK